MESSKNLGMKTYIDLEGIFFHGMRFSRYEGMYRLTLLYYLHTLYIIIITQEIPLEYHRCTLYLEHIFLFLFFYSVTSIE